MNDSRRITPMVLGLLTIMTAILVAVVNNLASEIRAVRVEVAESRKFAIQYTDKMIELIVKEKE